MPTYTKDEIVSVNELTKNFSQILINLRAKEKLAISNNNKLEAVLIDINEYELLKNVYNKLEDREIEQILEERTAEDKEVSHSKTYEI